jgi:hypothetical protein
MTTSEHSIDRVSRSGPRLERSNISDLMTSSAWRPIPGCFVARDAAGRKWRQEAPSWSLIQGVPVTKRKNPLFDARATGVYRPDRGGVGRIEPRFAHEKRKSALTFKNEAGLRLASRTAR